jgi:hypothetical protein
MLQNYLPKVNPIAEVYNLPVLQNRNFPSALEMCGHQLAHGEFISKRPRKEEN